MKTFKLKSLVVIENKQTDIIETKIPLIDGLIIDREDDKNQWIIEAYIGLDYLTYFEKIKNEGKDMMIKVKITKESNAPAIFITSIIGMNEIDSKMNVLFKGKIVDQRNNEIEQMLKTLIDKNFEGEALFLEFKRRIEKK